MDDARAWLAAERARVLERLAALTGDYDAVVAASLDTNADDEHDPEGATIAFERSQIGALVAQAREHLAEVDLAVARLDDATYVEVRASHFVQMEHPEVVHDLLLGFLSDISLSDVSPSDIA